MIQREERRSRTQAATHCVVESAIVCAMRFCMGTAETADTTSNGNKTLKIWTMMIGTSR